MEGNNATAEQTPAPRVAIVGCGAAKRDLDPGETVEIGTLYTSNYATLKREYAEVLCDDWYILSAKYGLVRHDTEVETYDHTLDDLEPDTREAWRNRVREQFREALARRPPSTTWVLLAGQQYLDALNLTIRALGVPVERPFDDTSGIGEQMGWLRAQIDVAQEGR